MSDSPRSSKVPPMLAMVLLFSTLVGGARPAWGWGDLGHKIVCQIAFQELNNKARAEVVRLIALDETFDSFTDACTWPDHPRNGPRSTLSMCPGPFRPLLPRSAKVHQRASSRPS
jgi:hypothetical protein